jgi:predicted dehydrogenase
MRALRIGILGTGRMAAAFAKDVRTLEAAGVIVSAVGSRHRDTASSFAAQHAIARSFGRYEDLAADPDIDIVYVATPHAVHEAHTLLCLRSGKHVLCEKPLALNAAQADRMIECARAQGKFLMEAMWTRFLPAIGALRQHIDAGVLGRLRLVVGGGAFVPDPDPDHYLRQRDLGGGVLLDAGVYLVSLVSALLGAPHQVRSSGIIGPSGVDEQDVWLTDHANGAQAVCYLSLHTRRAPDLQIMGESARMTVHPPVFCPTQLTLYRSGVPDETLSYPLELGGYCYQVLEVLRCVRLGLQESPHLPLAESRAVMVAMDQIRAQVGMRYKGE